MQRAAFPNSTFSVERWHTMATSSPYQRARCLVAYDSNDAAVAAVTVWSAGQGRPGLLEPLGVHRDHRGHGFGTAISVAAAAALQELAPPARPCAPRAATSAPWRRTRRPASDDSRPSPTSTGRADPTRTPAMTNRAPVAALLGIIHRRSRTDSARRTARALPGRDDAVGAHPRRSRRARAREMWFRGQAGAGAGCTSPRTDREVRRL